MRVLNLVLVLALLTGCGMPKSEGTLRIGHGGSGTNSPYPMNSEAALLNGLANGMDGIELDVQLTADSVLVAYHPELLQDLTACTGKVNSMSWTELQRCPNVNEADSPFPIVRLDQLLPALALKYPNADFTLDCKLFAHGEWWHYLRTYTRALSRLNGKLSNKLVVECQVEDFLRLVQLEAPDIPLYVYGSDVEASIRRAATSHFTGVTMSVNHLGRDDVTMAHELGLKVSAFNVSGYWSRRKALLAGVDRIQFDDISY
ncbi:MAG: hypothetical protein IPI00_15930 [Flavobacteriales bacterium]|nr:hypothetical protein [Flavobacteriales bacterium]MBK7241611.1 hypothetical protein [Flavobacteriales bacterium]MBK7296404.1 hypothetical protein [Flavobacteriales bacterium]MBK9534948.1 hypothetical protein [Flavobacteriales bacterium]MBP9138483.1 hypothetical protein [Flavobacteriales bacterium]